SVPRRIWFFCGLAVLLHLILLPTLGRIASHSVTPVNVNTTVQVHLHSAPDKIVATPAVKSSKPPSPTTSRHSAPQSVAATLPVANASRLSLAATAVALTSDDLKLPDASSVAEQVPLAFATEQQKHTAPPDTPDTPAFAVMAPQSGLMHMQVIRTEPGLNPVYGLGEIEWNIKNGKYAMRIEASLDLLLTSIKLYKLQSEGVIDTFGITPTISTESRRNRSETATHFDHQARMLHFSSSNTSTAMADGAQDKATVLMQLAGMGIAAPAQFQPGREIAIQVAEDRSATTFVFVVAGEEELDTKIGKLQTWHLIRPPLPGSYHSKLEIWLAPEQDWYPVQIRNTESNGAVTTQTVTSLALHPNLER
ncbi:MAG: DUF3108 domain-containing protein, partial [Burkholderiales bacterium]|nr:DUF3108 domain-containing protein [Burkholderiales bacterium]